MHSVTVLLSFLPSSFCRWPPACVCNRYGYTSANFSGRMPCVDIADSIVSKGRETLEKAIRLVEGTSEWNARVVYGDTDSLFVLLPGASKAEAFRIGQAIAERVTFLSPPPVQLKFEKVYFPCFLETKKRYSPSKPFWLSPTQLNCPFHPFPPNFSPLDSYVGYAYETPGQVDPVFDAKGIETVRRDGCPLVAKMLEKSLRVLFETKDLSTVKQYTQTQWQRILDGRLNLSGEKKMKKKKKKKTWTRRET